MGGGGGGQSGGAVVGGASPLAAMVAGQYQVQAAQAASEAAQRAMNDAINAMNRQYTTARADVQPYRTEGVQALNQLNQYLQLDPYNPGTAPTAPKKYTPEDLAGEVTKNAIRDYINQNTTYTSNKKFIHPVYTGAGSEDPNVLQAARGQTSGIGKLSRPGYIVDARSFDQAQPLGILPGSTIFGPNYAGTAIPDAVRLELAKELATQRNATYDTQYQDYIRNLEEWQQNKDWYNQYQAEGPFTTQQISERMSNLPGYQAELEQGVDAIQKAASARGYLGSGRVLKELSRFGQGTLSKFYGAELDRLAQLAGAGQQAAGGSAQMASTLGGNQAGLYQQFGDTKANAALASGNALAQAILAANQQYRIIGGDSGGGGGLGGIGSVLGGVGSIIGAMKSSKELKHDIKTVSTKEILENIKALKLDQWKYKGIDQEFIGPYAEEFTEKFKVGDGKTIDLVSYLGVLLGSIKELAKEVEALKKERIKHAR